MKKLTKHEIDFLIQTLQNGEDIPLDFQYKLFPTKQKEYELVYAGKMRREDLLANEDGVFPVPLQVEKVFNGSEYEGFKDNWKNMIVFGDNLQFLKTIYENKDPLIKDKVKGKVKLIYIDPPFGTGDEYDGNKGQSAYSAKRKGTDFVEFMRRRLILAREILADDGVIVVRQGYNFGHFIKIVLDEVFTKRNLINEIIVNRGKQRLGGSKRYVIAYDHLYCYSKIFNNYYFTKFTRERYKNEADRTNLIMKGQHNQRDRFFTYEDKEIILQSPDGKHWKFSQEKINEMTKKGIIYFAKSRSGLNSGIKEKKGEEWIPTDIVPSYKFDEEKAIDTNWTDIPGYTQDTGYPTENSELLLERVIKTFTEEEDLIIDFFCGSGTTLAVAEKLKRNWVGCDIAKLSIYTIQKRLLEIERSKCLENPKKEYGKKAKNFFTARLGIYDLKQALNLEWQKYQEFVASLFEVELKKHKIAGFEFDGKKDDYPVEIFDYRKFKDSAINENYLREIQSVIGTNERVYIIAPINFIEFLTDYYEIGGTKYYFLKIPYHIIKELHKTPFQKLRQPQSKKNVNDLEEAIGFHFIRQPEVKSQVQKNKEEVKIFIESFMSKELDKKQDEKEIKNFETLSAVFVDKNYDEKAFVMDEAFFSDELLKKDWQISFKKSELGKKIMIIYTDIYGNDFIEIHPIK